MIKLILSFLICGACVSSYAQITNDGRGADLNMQARSLFHVDVNGKPFVNFGGEDVTDGTPFFGERWMRTSAVFSDGKQSTPFLSRINLLSGDLHFLNSKGAEYISTSPVSDVFLTDTVTGASYHFVRFGIKNDNSPKNAWHQVLVGDSIVLYKGISKTISENKATYGSTIATKSITTTDRYVVRQGDQASVIKKPKDVVALFPAQKEKLSRFIADQAASQSVETQLTQLIKYLNSLLK